MKLRYFLKNNKKTYTLKQSTDKGPTKDAHYKFIHSLVKDAPKSH